MILGILILIIKQSLALKYLQLYLVFCRQHALLERKMHFALCVFAFKFMMASLSLKGYMFLDGFKHKSVEELRLNPGGSCAFA